MPGRGSQLVGRAMRKLIRTGRRREPSGRSIRRRAGEYVPIPVLGRILESEEKQLVIGRQGAGKTALRKALVNLADDHYVPSEVTPDDLSLPELRELELGGLNAEETMFLFWRYVVAIRVARYAVVHAEEHEHPPGSAGVLRKFLVDSGELGEPGFKERIFRYAAGLKSLSLSVGLTGVTASADFGGQPGVPEGTRTRRMLVSIEDQIMRVLADLQCPASHPGLLLLADEIHNVWSGDAQSNAVVAGLLRAARYAQEEYARVRCLVFLPDAIYDSLQFPDRNVCRGSETHLTWTAGSLRDLAEAQSKTAAGRAWKTLPATKIDGQPTIDYLISRTLHRPRDLDQLVKLCRDTADRYGRAEVSLDDITEAEAEFSRWKLEDLEAEYKTRYPFLPDLLYLFHDTAYAFPRHKADSLLAAHTPDLLEWFPAAASVAHWPGLLQVLYEVSFLGVRRGAQIVYSYDSAQMIEPADREFHVHPCFRRALRLTAGEGLELYRPMSPADEPVTRSRIGLWGAPGSGKTTFLAALPAAAAQARMEPMVYGADDTSTEILTALSNMLTVGHEFPQLSFETTLLSLAVTRPVLPVRRLSRRPAATAMQELAVSILDMPGDRFSTAQLYGEPRWLTGAIAGTPEDIAEYLARCDGLIYCFDPLREQSTGDAYAHFEGILLKMAQLRLQDARSGKRDKKLPHRLAVCATKFDALPVLETARTMNLLTVDQEDPHQMPRVPDADAAEVFASLCRQSRSGTAELIPAEISRYFHQDRVKYFITTAVGFHIDPSTGRFDPGDPHNALTDSNLAGKLRGPIQPINIIEPLLWIGEHTIGWNPE
jgi:GTPase SAR1 family protein